MLVGHFYIFFGEIPIQILWPFKNWVVFFVRVLYIHWIYQILSDLQIFSPILCAVLSLLMVLFEAQKFYLLSLNYVFFSFLTHAFGVIFKNPLQSQGHEDLAMLPPKSLIILVYIKSLIHFELMYIWCEVRSSISFFCASHNFMFFCVCEQKFKIFNLFFYGLYFLCIL